MREPPKSTCLSSALQVVFEVGRFRYLPRVKFQQAARINLHYSYGLLVLIVVIGKEASGNLDSFCSLEFTCFLLLSRLGYTPTNLCRLHYAWLDFFHMKDRNESIRGIARVIGTFFDFHFSSAHMNTFYAAFPICCHPNNTANQVDPLFVRINIDMYNRGNAHREARNSTFCDEDAGDCPIQ